MEYGYRPSSSRSISRTSRMAVEGRLTTGTRHCSTSPEQYRLALTRAATVPPQYPYLDRVIICRVHHATSIIYILITTSSFSPLVISCPFIILYHPLSSFILLCPHPLIPGILSTTDSPTWNLHQGLAESAMASARQPFVPSAPAGPWPTWPAWDADVVNDWMCDHLEARGC